MPRYNEPAPRTACFPDVTSEQEPTSWGLRVFSRFDNEPNGSDFGATKPSNLARLSDLKKGSRAE
jgi:hypothetical protein